MISQLLENVRLAGTTGTPTCQDTGMAVVFARLGSRVLFYGGTPARGRRRRGARRLHRVPPRKSVVDDPFRRTNTRTTPPPSCTSRRTTSPGRPRASVLPRVRGREHEPAAHAPPSAGWEGLLEVVVETVVAAGPNACPPLVVGAAGGRLRAGSPTWPRRPSCGTWGRPTRTRRWPARALLLEAVNATGVGPQGLGGTMTATAVHLEVYATHIASLPVAVNLGCNAYRHRTALLRGHPHPPDSP